MTVGEAAVWISLFVLVVSGIRDHDMGMVLGFVILCLSAGLL